MNKDTFPSHLLSISDLTRVEIEDLINLAIDFKEEKNLKFFKNPPLIATFFLENSTRTKLSFQIATLRLGGSFVDLNPNLSSLRKGESMKDTLNALADQGIDLCIIRSSEKNFFSQLKKPLSIRMINAGDGTREHPTQVLGDVLTLNELWSGEFSGKTLTIIGDIIHSRVANSLMAIAKILNFNIVLTGHQDFLPTDELPKHVKIIHNREKAVENTDALYLLRIQNERHKSLFNLKNYSKEWGFQLDAYRKLKYQPPILHPGPVNIGMEISEDLLGSSLYYGRRQVALSIPMRMAILFNMIKKSTL